MRWNWIRKVCNKTRETNINVFMLIGVYNRVKFRPHWQFSFHDITYSFVIRGYWYTCLYLFNSTYINFLWLIVIFTEITLYHIILRSTSLSMGEARFSFLFFISHNHYWSILSSVFFNKSIAGKFIFFVKFMLWQFLVTIFQIE